MREEIRQIKELDGQLDDTSFKDFCQLAQRFLLAVNSLHAAIASPVGASTLPKTTGRSISQLQQQFQEIIAAAEAVRIDPQMAQRIRPCLTEGHRRLRLAGIEAMRLQAAKQPVTVEKQRSLIQAHLDQLQKFACAIADEVCPDPSGEMPACTAPKKRPSL